MKYIAADHPDYDIIKGVEPQHEKTDEGYGMAYKNVHARNALYKDACDVMAEKLTEIAAMDHVIRANESVQYQAAALIFSTAPRTRYPHELAVRIGGRVYVVAEMPA